MHKLNYYKLQNYCRLIPAPLSGTRFVYKAVISIITVAITTNLSDQKANTQRKAEPCHHDDYQE